MHLPLTTSPVRAGQRLLGITTTTFDKLAELHLNTCARYAERNLDNLSGIYKAEGLADLVHQQRDQYQALWSDGEDFMRSASAIIRGALKQVNELMAIPPQTGAAAPAESVATARAEQPLRAEAVFELFADENGEHRFRLRRAGGAELLTSASYKTKKGAGNGVEVVRKNAGMEERYERIETDSGLSMFNLKAGNHQIIGTSAPYPSAAAMEAALTMVKTASVTAKVVER